MDFLFILLAIAFGYAIGKIHGYYTLAKIIKELAEESGFDIEKELSKMSEEGEEKADIVRKLKIDVSGDILYLFDLDTDTFICQANCVQELAKIAKERSQILYAVVKQGDKFFTFKDGESIEVKVTT
jgi:hypothetical protein